jgi:tRNA pseudouridine55 synthase
VTDGLLVVDKPAGWTSHDVVAKLRGVCGQRRIGHAGTLDPDATGVLLVGLGRVTRLLRFLQETTKEYRGVVVFGVATDSLDAAGAVLERKAMPVGKDEVRRAMDRFVGDISQVPPMVSALKVGGRRLHQLAREGKEVEREPRLVHIDRFVPARDRPRRVLEWHLHTVVGG